jgi:hypothetical protein
MTAVDRCVGHVGGTGGEDELGSGVAAMVASSGGGRVRSRVTTGLVGKPPQAARQDLATAMA